MKNTTTQSAQISISNFGDLTITLDRELTKIEYVDIGYITLSCNGRTFNLDTNASFPDSNVITCQIEDDIETLSEEFGPDSIAQSNFDLLIDDLSSKALKATVFIEGWSDKSPWKVTDIKLAVDGVEGIDHICLDEE